MGLGLSIAVLGVACMVMLPFSRVDESTLSVPGVVCTDLFDISSVQCRLATTNK